MTQEEFLNRMDTKTPTVFIMRGLPGSGKSTLANKLRSQYQETISLPLLDLPLFVVSADDYWMREGKYRFDSKLVPQNHYWCLQEFIFAISRTKNRTIVVDNTNTTLKEFDHYVKIAQAYGYKVVVVTNTCSVKDSMARNTHNVPEDTIRRMHERLISSWGCVEAFAAANKVDHFCVDTTQESD